MSKYNRYIYRPFHKKKPFVFGSTFTKGGNLVKITCYKIIFYHYLNQSLSILVDHDNHHHDTMVVCSPLEHHNLQEIDLYQKCLMLNF